MALAGGDERIVMGPRRGHRFGERSSGRDRAALGEPCDEEVKVQVD
jgi:hypothetical protein